MPSSRSSDRHSPAHWFSLKPRHTLSRPLCKGWVGAWVGGGQGQRVRRCRTTVDSAPHGMGGVGAQSGTPTPRAISLRLGFVGSVPRMPERGQGKRGCLLRPHSQSSPGGLGDLHTRPPAACTSTRCRSTGGAGCRTRRPAPLARSPPPRPRWHTGAGWPRSAGGGTEGGSAAAAASARGWRRRRQDGAAARTNFANTATVGSTKHAGGAAIPHQAPARDPAGERQPAGQEWTGRAGCACRRARGGAHLRDVARHGARHAVDLA